MIRQTLAGAALLLLAACSTSQQQDAHTQFVTIESGATILATTATAYVSLPTCPAKPVCANPPVVQRIAQANAALRVAIVQGRAVFANLASTQSDLQQAVVIAQAALDSFKQVTSDPAVVAALQGASK